MKKIGHSPSPWKLTRKTKDGYQYIDGKNWWHLARIVVEVGGEPSLEGQANARLIAAAPELLEACIALYNARGNATRLQKALIKAEKAINKAEGR